MKDKHLIVVIITVGALVSVGLFALGEFGSTTSFDNKFISGEIQQPAALNEEKFSNFNLPEGWYYLYESNNMSYEFFVVKNATLIKKIIKLIAYDEPQNYSYNGVKWEIYSFDLNSAKFNKIKEIIGDLPFNQTSYMAITSKNGVDYFVTINILTKSKGTSINSSKSILFNDTIIPLLDTIVLKDVSSTAPTESKIYNTSNDKIGQTVEYLDYVI
jgi:hypothetical protein